MIERRRCLLGMAATALAWSPVALAQTPWRVAFLSAGGRPSATGFSTIDAVISDLKELGQRQLVTETWFGDGRAERLPDLTQQVLAWKPDLIVTVLTPAAVAAQRATHSIPIVMAGAGDPVASGVVQSLARPGGNVTGVAALGPELAVKCIELMRETLPGLRRLGVLANDTDPFTPALLQQVEPAATQLGMQLQVERVRGAAQYEAVFKAWERQRVDAMFLQPSLPQGPAIQLALRLRLPSCSFTRGFVEAGGLVAYAPDLRETAMLAATMADRILRGAAPAQLPVQQNTRFDLLVNRRTAQAIGITVPQGVLLRATEVIE